MASPSPAALHGSLGYYANVKGPDIVGRLSPFAEWQDLRKQNGVWPYGRVQETAPRPWAVLRGDAGHPVRGITFASQDYLALSRHPAIVKAVQDALLRFGPHSAGSPVVNGHTSLSLELREALAPLVGTRHIVLFPTGWAAGFGAITGLMRRDDHILIDELAHACLRRGALAATPHVSPFPHLDNDAAETRLRAIRQREPRAAIMVITEGVFSMDSDSPRLTRLRELCRDYNAVLLVDQAHDLGVTGPGGTGRVGAEGLVGEVDLVVGSFSKVFACNGGFVATPSAEVASYLRMFAESHAYSCALSPLQAAGALAAARIVQSGEGQRLRDRVLGAATRLRDALRAEGLVVLGEPSPVVPVEVGAAAVARRSWALAEAGGLITSLVEFPIVPRGHSRFRMQVMADHSDADIDQAAHILGGCIATARHAAAVLA